METNRLYRIVAKINGDDVEIISGITAIDFAEKIRELIYKSHPELEGIVIIEYVKLISFPLP